MANKLDSLNITGELAVASGGSVSFPNSWITNSHISGVAGIARSKLAQDNLQPFDIPLFLWRTWDDLTAALPGTAAADDLALIEGTFGTDFPTIQTSDAAQTTVTQRTRTLRQVPAEYVDGETLTFRVRAGMVTTASDGTATLDIEVYLSDGDGSVGSDICATAAQSINSLTKADFDFTITPTGVVAGDQLDIRLTIAITDSASGTAVIGEVSKTELLADIKG